MSERPAGTWWWSRPDDEGQAPGAQPPAGAPSPGESGTEEPGTEVLPALSGPPPQAPTTVVLPAGQPPAPYRRNPWAGPGWSGGGPMFPAPPGPPPSGPPPRHRSPLLVVALVLVLVGGAAGGVLGGYLESHRGSGGSGASPTRSTGPADLARSANSIPGIARRLMPSVVYIDAKGSSEEGTGTGLVLDTSGDILTNNHVATLDGAGAKTITVTLNDGRTVPAKLVGRDTGYDLAVLRIKGVSGLKPVPLGNSDQVKVGEPVVAIGAPFGLAGTVTTGIISAKHRPVTTGGQSGQSDLSYVDALQTDAAINPGNSGGPLVDAKGLVIGINTAIMSSAAAENPYGGQAQGQGGSIGLGFAIPINEARKVAEQLITTGHAVHPVIGVSLDIGYQGDGAKVSDAADAVQTGGPAATAGMLPGDVVTAADGQPVQSGEALIVLIRSKSPGDHLRLTVRRDGQALHLTVVLGRASGD